MGALCVMQGAFGSNLEETVLKKAYFSGDKISISRK
jgi:hypothetical protein